MLQNVIMKHIWGAGRWIEGVHAWRCVSESLALLALAVVIPTAISTYWESKFRAQLIQEHDTQGVGLLLGSGSRSFEQKIRPWWSYLFEHAS